MNIPQPTQQEIELAIQRAKQERAQAAANLLQTSLNYLTQTSGNIWTKILTGVIAAGSCVYLIWLYFN